jgi:hypothetical protein
MRFAGNCAHCRHWICIRPERRLCVRGFLHDKPSTSRNDIGPTIRCSAISAQSPVAVVSVDSAW